MRPPSAQYISFQLVNLLALILWFLIFDELANIACEYNG
ncbi:hypothetical protein ykris0001_8420 [Yersinia kristensenii ATCC 33638]|nr:hypothetical protein ykris0001_8420 [Yersinia kristensenii ATCC 33638]